MNTYSVFFKDFYNSKQIQTDEINFDFKRFVSTSTEIFI